jgi:hypothetical protein
VFADLAVTDREFLAEMQIIWVRNNLVVQCAEQYPALRVPVKHRPPNPFARKPVPLGSGQAETELLPTDVPTVASVAQTFTKSDCFGFEVCRSWARFRDRRYDGKTQRNETPEEYVRQEIAKSLVREYQYEKAHIEVEFTVRVGSKKPRADLVEDFALLDDDCELGSTDLF